MRPFAISLVTLLSLAASPVAHAAPPVSVLVEGLFGEDAIVPGRINPVRVRLQNRTSRAIRGSLEVRSSVWGQRVVPHVLGVDLPPREKRWVTLSMPVMDSGSSVEAGFVVGGRRVAGHTLHLGYGTAPVVVLLADPPRLLGGLLSPGSPGVAASAVSLHEATGDPVLPTRADGWAPVSLLVVSGPMLARIASDEERRAIAQWIGAGGQMLVMPRTDADLVDPFLASLVGPLRRCEGLAHGSSQFAPEGAPNCLEGDARFEPDQYGGSARVGFGRVHVTAYDAMTGGLLGTPEPLQLIRVLAAQERFQGETLPVFVPGTELAPPEMGMGFFGHSSFHSLRPALDPNEAFRPALLIVAFLLILYVIVVGPLNFKIIEKRNAPTLALVTTPMMAAACMTLLFGVGWVAKGVTMRHRTVELMELPEGSSDGVARRFRGLFLTRPASIDVPFPADGFLSILGTGASRAEKVDLSGAIPAVREVRGRLWDTLFTREDRWVDAGGSVNLIREGGRVVMVENQLDEPLLGAFVVYPSGDAHMVGRVEPGKRAEVESARRFELSTPNHPRYLGELEWEQVGAEIGVERADILSGLASMSDHTLAATAGAVLLARLPAPASGSYLDRFEPEAHLRFVRVAESRPAVPVDEVPIRADVDGPPWEAMEDADAAGLGGAEDAGVSPTLSTDAGVADGEGP